MTSTPPADFIILCGFLGSGKTTLISRYLESVDTADTAVIVNDVGAINVDGAVLATAGDLALARLANGCVCCSLGNALLETIEGLIEDRRRSAGAPLRRFILECSGISDPAPIVRSLAALGAGRFRIKIVCTYSCLEQDRHVDQFSEAAAQLAAANAVVLTKTDLVDEQGIARAGRRASRLAPFGRVIACVDSQESARLALALDDPQRSYAVAGAGAGDAAAGGGPAPLGLFSELHPRISVHQLSFDAPVDWRLLEEWLENLIGCFGERVLRIKGIVRVLQSSQPILIQSVGTHLDQPREIQGGQGMSALFIVLRDVALPALREVGPPLPHASLRRLAGLPGAKGGTLRGDGGSMW